MSTQQQTPLMASVEAQLKQDLMEPRFLKEQVLEEIQVRYDFDAHRISDFFQEQYGQLEDYQADLIFSPLFTPAWEDKVRYAKLLGFEAFSDSDVKELVRNLEKQELSATFQTQTGETWSAVIHPVNLERYITRIGLNLPLSETLATHIKQHVPQDDQHAVGQLARDNVWKGEQREALLKDYLSVFHINNSFALDKVRYMTDFVRTYRPATHEDMVRQLESLIKSCESDLNNVADHSMFDQQLKELYTESERAHFKNIDVQNHYTRLMNMAKALLDEQSALIQLKR